MSNKVALNKTVKAKPTFDLNIELALVERTAKRKIRVGANITFERLHKIIQAAYNWHEAHLYQFFLFKEGIECERPSVEIVISKEEASNPKSARLVHRAKLCDYLNEYKHLMYIYDFGDEWMHYIDVVGSADDSDKELPILLDGENDAPPEDCGGAPGFEDFLEAINNPNHSEHEEMLEWSADQGWERFDLSRAGLRVFMAGNPGRHVWVKES